MLAVCRKARVLAGLTLVAAGVAGVGSGEEKPMPVRGFRYPVELYKDGRIKTHILAEELTGDPESGEVEAVHVKVEFFTPDGHVDAVLDLERCCYDRDSGRTTSDSRVRLKKGGLLVTGKGMEWHAGEQRIRILQDAKVVLDRDLRARRRRRLASGKERGTKRSE